MARLDRAVRGLLLGGVLLAAVAEGASVPPPRFEDPARRAKLEAVLPALDAIAARHARERGWPGLAWGVVVDGELARFGSVGVADLDAGTPIDVDTVFRIASMSKSFTALAVLKLRDAGRVDLDAPVARYVPELADLAPPTADSGPVTVRDLLRHTGGFPEDNPWGDRQMAITDAELGARLEAGIPFSTGTGSRYEYSNYGFALLGRLVENVTGEPFPAWVRRELLAPLAMDATVYEPAEVPPARLARGYRFVDGRALPETPLPDGAFGPMGGLLTSSRDLARWVAFLLDAFPPRDGAERGPALRRTVRELQRGSNDARVTLRRDDPNARPEAVASSYAFGLRQYDSCTLGRHVSHGGGFPGFGSTMVWLPERGVGVFAMANRTYAGPFAMAVEMLETLVRSGAMEPRRPQPAPILVRRAEEVAALLDAWDDAALEAIAADNLFLDESLPRRRAAVGALRDGLGACAAGPLRAENALRGRFRMVCEGGWLDATLTLAPTQPPRVQYLRVTGGRTPSAALLDHARAVVDAMNRGERRLPLAEGVAPDPIAGLLAIRRLQHGHCTLGDPVTGDGVARQRFALACDRGALELELAIAEAGITELVLTPAAGAACVP